MFVLRYLPDVPLNKRVHGPTVGTYTELGDAQDHLDALPIEFRDLLQIEER